MAASTRRGTDGQRTWWWGASAVVVAVAVGALLWLLLGTADDPVAQVESAPTAAAEPTPSPAPTAPPTSSPAAEPTSEPEPTREAEPSASPTEPDPAPEPDTEPLAGASHGPFFGGTTPPRDGSWIADVRTAGHAGYDRVVFEFDGAVVPTYQVGYTATPGPFYDIPGDVVAVEGNAFIEVWLQGTSRVDMSERYTPVYTGPTRLAGDTRVVTEVVEIEDFEANVRWVIGLEAPTRLVVWTLDAPSRLVIDIET